MLEFSPNYQPPACRFGQKCENCKFSESDGKATRCKKYQQTLRIWRYCDGRECDGIQGRLGTRFRAKGRNKPRGSKATVLSPLLSRGAHPCRLSSQTILDERTRLDKRQIACYYGI
jgi:hypothetical protein